MAYVKIVNPVDNVIGLIFLVVEISCFQTILIRWISLDIAVVLHGYNMKFPQTS